MTFTREQEYAKNLAIEKLRLPANPTPQDLLRRMAGDSPLGRDETQIYTSILAKLAGMPDPPPADYFRTLEIGEDLLQLYARI